MAEESKIALEREYTVPLRDKFRHTPKYKRVPKAIKALKQFIAKHMKINERDLKYVKLDKLLNEEIWFRGIQYPPARIKVKAVKYEDGIVRVELSELPEILKFKAEREKKKKEVKVEEKKEEKKPEEGIGKEKKEEKEKEQSGKEKEIKAAKAEAKEKKHEVVGKKIKNQQPRRMVLKK